MSKMLSNEKETKAVLESRVTPRYYKNEYYDDGDYWTLKITRLRDNVVTYVKLDEADVDAARNHSWYPHHDPSKPDNLVYLKSTGGYRLHRVITGCPEGKIVDHINHDPLDNRRSNMRICSVGENNSNLSLSKRNSSGVVGVRYRADRKSWIANKMVNGKLYTKAFKTFEEAVKYKTEVLDKLTTIESNL